MALRASESCDLISTTQLQGGSGRWTYTSAGGGSVTVAAGRNGNGFSFNHNNGGTLNIARAFDDQATWIVGFSLNLTLTNVSDIRILSFFDNTTEQVSLWLRTSDKKLELRRGATVLATSSDPIAVSVSNYIECKVTVNNSTGLAELRQNQAVTATFTGNTRQSANNFANRIVFGATAASNAATVVIDDIYINDGTGSTNNSYIGDVLVKALLPNGAGAHTDFTPSTGSNYAAVDETPANDDTDYVSSGTVGHIDTYTYPDLATNVNTVKAVVVVPRWRKDDAGGRTMSEVARVGSTDYAGTAVGITQTYGYHERIMEANPATAAAWSRSEVDAAEFGVKIES